MILGRKRGKIDDNAKTLKGYCLFLGLCADTATYHVYLDTIMYDI